MNFHSAPEPVLRPETARLFSEHYIRLMPDYPGGYRGRGLVLCAGGVRYFTPAWVCIRMLRHLGCPLPIQLWHLGRRECDARMEDLVRPFGVECVDASEVRKRHPVRLLSGWELKPYALLHCPFREVLLLDADNVAVLNPQYLFETPEFRETGAVFWPDFGRLAPDRLIWNLCGVDYRDEPEFESGQIVLDKERCWRALRLAMWYNEHSDFFYQYVHGDKETFHLAFRKLAQPYAMTPFPIYPIEDTMCQHDFEGRRVFQHRNLDKWSLFEANKIIWDFWNEDLCRVFLDELKQRWDGRIQAAPFDLEGMPSEAHEAARELTRHVFEYRRWGHDVRGMRFLPDGTIGLGAASCERYWNLTGEESDICLQIAGEDGMTCELKRDPDGVWRGRWLRFERMPVELTVNGDSAGSEDL
jgi:Mannosyltransferase putative